MRRKCPTRAQKEIEPLNLALAASQRNEQPRPVDFFLLDTNLFREATKSPQNQLIEGLVSELQLRGLSFGKGGTPIRISPFGLLEALGIVVPAPPLLPVDWRKEPMEVYGQIFDAAQNHFRNLPALQSSHLEKMRRAQLAYVIPEARPLFDVCVTSVLARPVDLTAVLASFLAADYFFKYQFTPAQFQKMAQFLAAAFFIDVPAESPTSRFRLSKRMLDLIQPKMQVLPEHQERAPALTLKNDRDFLDTDIIQEITYGFPFEGARHRVVALTFDSARSLEIRAQLHRQVGISWGAKCRSDDVVRHAVMPYLAHPGGLVLQFDRAGRVVGEVDLKKTFASMAPREPRPR